ncbi:hypothetical protein Ahy_A07g035995 [Arachis hypogaea]|uniref:BED-type domain-containing protein n=1 Tax=Arachis hypogaea TaxID=3818 RepID=A0A445CEZ2_ARAHY|nr:hypothetical protein Ahy_A07g035995 [Arachis hypogaea]
MTEDIKKKKTKATISDVWIYFTKLGPGDDGIDRAQCDGCKQKFKAGGKQYGTSTLKHHLDRCVKIDFEDIGQTLIEMQNKMGALKIDNHVSREIFAAFVIDCDVPFSIVDNKKFRNWVKYISPTLGLITRNTLKEDVLKIYLREKEKFKSTLLAIPNRVCLISDLWTSITTEDYLYLTAHFVDLNWKLQSKILSFCHMPPPHTGFELSSKIFELLNEWGIETTNLISGTSYPTSNLYFLQVYHIQYFLMGSLRSEDELLRSMREKMMNKFKKYWKKYSVNLAFGAILDP